MKGHYNLILFLFFNLAEYFCENMMKVCAFTSPYFLWYRLWQLWHITTPLSWLKYRGFVLLHLMIWCGSRFSPEPQMTHSLWSDKRSLAHDCSFQYFCDDCIFNSIMIPHPSVIQILQVNSCIRIFEHQRCVFAGDGDDSAVFGEVIFRQSGKETVWNVSWKLSRDFWRNPSRLFVTVNELFTQDELHQHELFVCFHFKWIRFSD